jgi:hypothetical protein
MVTINRTAIVVMPGQLCLDWLRRADPTSNELSLEEIWGQIFEELLDGWYRAPS